MKNNIPFYEVSNMFFTGAAFSILLFFIAYDYPNFSNHFLDSMNLFKDWSIVVSAAILVAMFEIGFILNKIGSVFLGRLLEKTKIWPKEEYSINVSKIEEINGKFKSLNTELHVTRTHIIMYLLLFIISLFFKKWVLSSVFFLLSIFFLFSGKRTNYYMNIIIKDFNEESEQ